MDTLFHFKNSLFEVCRLCRIKRKEMESLFQTKYKSQTLAEILTEIFVQLEVAEHDGLPQNICSMCRRNLLNTLEFQMMCLESQTILKKEYQQKQLEKDEVFLETELEVINDEDEIVKTNNKEYDNNLFIAEEIIMEDDQQEGEENAFLDLDAQVESPQKDDIFTTDIQYYEEYEVLDTDSITEIENGIVEADQKFCCTYCTGLFSDIDCLVYHFHRTHLYKQNDYKPKLVCDLCSFTTNDINSIRRHITTHRLRRKCPICPTWLKSDDNYKTHIENHKTGTGFLCSICKKIFNNKTTFDKHIKIKHDQKRFYVCNSCNKQYETATGLRDHVESKHNEGIIYQCSLCPKTFKTRSFWRAHLRIHTNTKRFFCNICDASYSQNKTLQVHLRKHNNDYRYQCKDCGKKFYKNSYYNEHIKTHTNIKEYKCTMCDREFQKRSDFFKHKRQHLGGLLYFCERCNLHFKYNKDYQDHINVHYVNDNSNSQIFN